MWEPLNGEPGSPGSPTTVKRQEGLWLVTGGRQHSETLRLQLILGPCFTYVTRLLPEESGEVEALCFGGGPLFRGHGE